MSDSHSAAVTRLAREESGHVLALLAGRFGLDIADESVQDALVEALDWREVPENPAAWLYTVARNRAVDTVRRAGAARRRNDRLVADLRVLQPSDSGPLFDDGEEPAMGPQETGEVGEERLRLMLLCAHPALARDTQVALTLRLVGGLTTAEISSALFVSEATLAQRIVRAKRKIRDAGIPLSLPEKIEERVDVLLGVLYLIFNEGYLSRGAHDGSRIDLMEEAIRLTIALSEHAPANAEVRGLLALELYTRARSEARFVDGRLVRLADQDRSRWDLELVTQADGILATALRTSAPSPLAIQAAIAGCHSHAVSYIDTDWPRIVSLYSALMTVSPSPVVALNRAVAVAMADGPLRALALLDDIAGLADYHLYWATRAELLLKAGRDSDARRDFERARSLATNPAESSHLDERILTLGAPLT